MLLYLKLVYRIAKSTLNAYMTILDQNYTPLSASTMFKKLSFYLNK